MSDPLGFIARLLNYYKSEGIFDEYDKDSNKMKTSAGIHSLMTEAQSFFPDMPKGEPARLMRELTPEQRAVSVADNDKVIDRRDLFAKKMQENGSSRGLLIKMTEALESGDSTAFAEYLQEAKKFKEYEDGDVPA